MTTTRTLLGMKSFGWNRGTVGDGSGGYSRRISVRLLWEPRDLWVGVYWTPGQSDEWFVYICLLPCLAVRIHSQKSYGGVFPEALQVANAIPVKPSVESEIQPGDEFRLRGEHGDPFGYKDGLTVKVLEVRSGWVRYWDGKLRPDERDTVEKFLRWYERVNKV